MLVLEMLDVLYNVILEVTASYNVLSCSIV